MNSPTRAMVPTALSLAPPAAAIPRPKKIAARPTAMALLLFIRGVFYTVRDRLDYAADGSVKVQGWLALVIGGTKK
jgi:hypothetical protein